MCGIFGYVGGGNATQIVFDGLKKLEYRGYDSWGIAAVKDGILALEKHVGKIGTSQYKLKPSSIALGHTRWATHGGVTVANSHPHLDCHGSLAVVHNGIIENYQELKAKLLTQGHTFVSETDTEVFAHLVEESSKKLSFSQSVTKSFKQLQGLNTVVVLSRNGTLIACRNGSPLVVGKTKKGELFLSSDLPSLLPYTQQISVLEDHDSVIVEHGKLISPLKFQHLAMDQSSADKGKYSHYLLKEISDQPESLRRLASSSQSSLLTARSAIEQASSIYVLGCGTAFYSMIEASYLFAKGSQHQLIALPANEFSSFSHLITKHSVVILASQSGETIDTLEAMREAKKRGATTIALVNVPSSTLTREVDISISLLAGVERAVVSTKAFTNMVATCYLLLGDSQALLSAASAIEDMLKSIAQQKIKSLADKLKSHQDIYLIGRGTSYAISLEGALKLKEAAYIHAEGFAGGELKHGVIALIEPGTPCIVIAAEDSENADILSGAMELKARGAWIIGVGPKQEAVYDDWLEVKGSASISPLTSIVPLQLLSYYLSIKKGINPDMPRNLAKSVTVK